MKRKKTTSLAKQSTTEQRRARRQWLNRRLLSYTATAGAALAVAGTANATVVYDAGFPSGGITVNSAGPWLDFNLIGQGSNQFYIHPWIRNTHSNSHLFTIRQIALAVLQPSSAPSQTIQPQARTAIHQGLQGGSHTGPQTPAPGMMNYAVARNQLIGASRTFSGSGFLALGSKGTRPDGYKINRRPDGDFVGVKFPDPSNSSQPDYGWIEFSTAFTPDLSVTILGWAYDDSEGPILAGDTGVPEPSSLAIWALGALGAAGACVLRRWKKLD